MASSKEVRPLGRVNTSSFLISSADVVKSTAKRGASAKEIRKNSSSGLAASQNWFTASRTRSNLSPILPLVSRMIPTDMGTSSLEKFRIVCGVLSSNTSKLSWLRPVTKRCMGSVTLTGTSTSFTSVLMTWSTESLTGWLDLVATAAVVDLDATCTSFTLVWAESEVIRKAVKTNENSKKAIHVKTAITSRGAGISHRLAAGRACALACTRQYLFRTVLPV